MEPGRPSSEIRELVKLAWPIAAAMAGETVIGLVDTKLVGGLGPAALGGVSVATTFMFLSYSVVWGLMRGVKVRAAYAVGEGRAGDGVRYAQVGVVIGAAIGVLVWLAGRDVSGALRFVGIEEALIPYARDFFAAVTYGAPGTAVLTALTQHRQGIGDSRTPMIVGLAGNVMNATLGYSLIYGRLGLPALGVRGGGYATAITETLEATAMLVVLAREARGGRSTLAWWTAAREVISLGLPTGLQFVSEMLAFTTFTAVLGSLGSAQIAAHQIAFATIRTSFLPGIAISEAACVRVGQALGRRSLAGADATTRAALVVATSFMAACGVVFAIFAGSIAGAFTESEEVRAVARRLLWIAALFQVLDAVNIVLRGALRGAKDVRFAAVIGISIVWTCIPSAAFFLGRLAGWGAFGGWCGFVAECTLSAILFGWRWRRGTWRRPFAGTSSLPSRTTSFLEGASSPL